MARAASRVRERSIIGRSRGIVALARIIKIKSTTKSSIRVMPRRGGVRCEVSWPIPRAKPQAALTPGT